MAEKERKEALVKAFNQTAFPILFGEKIPSSAVDYKVSTEFRFRGMKVTMAAGLTQSNSSRGTINFSNGLFDNFSTRGADSHTLEELGKLGNKASKYLKRKGFGEVSYTAGRIDFNKTGVSLVGLEVEDDFELNVSPYKAAKGFARCTFSLDLDFDDIVAGTAIVICIGLLAALEAGMISVGALTGVAASGVLSKLTDKLA